MDSHTEACDDVEVCDQEPASGASADNRPAVSICIVTWNCRELVLECLRSLRSGSDPEQVPYEVIVVDNASTDGCPEAIRAEFPEVRIIANSENRGFAAANNQAILAARGKWLFLLNPDTVLPEAAIPQLVQMAEKYPDAGAIGPRLINPDGSLQYSCRRFPRPWAALFRNTLLSRIAPNDRWTREYLMLDWDHEDVREVDWVSGAAMLLRREAVEQVGLLDEGFFWGSEDVDYCKRLWDAGWKVIYTPRPAIVHRIGGSTDKAVVQTIFRRHASWRRLYSKHFSRGLLDRLVMGVLIWARALLLAGSWVARWAWVRIRNQLRRLLRGAR